MTKDELQKALSDARGWSRCYAEQIEQIGQILIRARLLTRRAIRRDGVAFAVRNHFEPPKSHRKKTRRGAGIRRPC